MPVKLNELVYMALRIARSFAILAGLMSQLIEHIGHRQAIYPPQIFFIIVFFSQFLISIFDWAEKKASPFRALVPLVLLLFAVLSFLNPTRGALPVVAGAGISELLVVVVIVVTSLHSSTISANMALEDRLISAFSSLVSSEIASFLAKEVLIVFAAIRFLLAPLKRPASVEGAFTYRDSPTLMLLPALPIFVVPEMLATHLLLTRYPDVSHALIALQVYGLIWALGVFQLFRDRPHVIADGHATLRCGIFKSANVDLREIVTAQVVSIADEGERRRLHSMGYNMTLPDAPVVQINLSSEKKFPSGLLGRAACYARVYVSADAPTALTHALLTK